MVEAVRAGQSQRSVARRFHVSLATVQLWVKRAENKPLDQVMWEDASHAPHTQPRQTSPEMEGRIIEARRSLKESDLGEIGAQAIQAHLLKLPHIDREAVPSVPTINRILRRKGLFDHKQRLRHKPPPPGWYLPEVARRQAEIDETDYVEALYLEGGQELLALNTISLHGGLCATSLWEKMDTDNALTGLLSHWRIYGLPHYAQFDNGNVFVGPRQHPDTIGRVIRLCLSLSVTPVFAVPSEFGIQSAIEGYNNQWQAKVWKRYHFDSIEEARLQSDRYVCAVRQKRLARQEKAPVRRLFPAEWNDPKILKREGKIIFLRRTTQQGNVELLRHNYFVSDHWRGRIVRCELDLSCDEVRAFGLRRAEPENQPLLNTWSYRLPNKSRKKSLQLE